MTSTDVSEIAETLSHIKIDGPTADTPHFDEPVPNTESVSHIELSTSTANGSDSLDLPPAPPEPTISEVLVERDIPDVLEPATAPADDALFATGKYLTVPTMDGQAADELVIAFGGTVKFAASDPVGQTLFNDLRLGKGVSLRVDGFVGGKSGAFKVAGAGTDDEREVVVGKVSVKVTDLLVLTPESL